MTNLNQVKKELQEKNKLDVLTRKNCILLKQAWFKNQEQKCIKCGSIEGLTLDHIVPIEILSQFIDEDRVFNENWYQILCYKCNRFKSSKLDLVNPKTKEILLDLIIKSD